MADMEKIVVAVIPNDESKLLVVQRRKGRQDGIHWSLPSGGMKHDESEEQAVRREVAEETGLSVRPSRRLGETPSHDLLLVYWLCAAEGGTLRAEPGGATFAPTYLSPEELLRNIAPRKFSPPVAAYLGL